MTKYTWIKEEVPYGLKIKQVYGIVFAEDGNILLQIDNNKYNLTGGKPEPKDKSYTETLKREYIEELNVNIYDAQYLGYLLVEENNEKYAQVRMIAKIKSVGQIKPDVDNGKIYKRFMAKQENVKKYLNYEGIAGNQMIDDAIKIGNQKYKFNFKDNEYYI